MSLEQALVDNTAAVRELIAALANGKVPAPVVATADKPAPAAKATKAAAPKAEAPAPKEEPKAETEAPAAEDAPKVEYAAVAAAIVELAKTKGRDVALKVLGEFGVAKAPELKPEQYAAVIEAATKAGA